MIGTTEMATARLGQDIALLAEFKNTYPDKSDIASAAPIMHLIADVRAMAELAGMDVDAAERAARAVL
jgi:hypothetical protein